MVRIAGRVWKKKKILFLQLSFFYVLVYISFNFQRTKTQYIPNYCKCCEESAELNRFTLADLERELQPRKPVHFFFCPPLRCKSVQIKVSEDIDKDPLHYLNHRIF